MVTKVPVSQKWKWDEERLNDRCLEWRGAEETVGMKAEPMVSSVGRGLSPYSSVCY